MFFKKSNSNKKQNSIVNQKGLNVRNNNQYNKTKNNTIKNNVKKEKIIKINNPNNIEYQINNNCRN